MGCADRVLGGAVGSRGCPRQGLIIVVPDASRAAARPAGTGVAHAFRAGAAGLVLLAFGTRDPADICFYPRSGKLRVRGLGATFRVQRVPYWDGEE